MASKHEPEAQPKLLPQHQKLIGESGIDAAVAVERGYRSITTKAELARLGFAPGQRGTPALLLPIWNVHGEMVGYQIRPDEPRAKDGKIVKYEMPQGMRMVLDVPQRVRKGIGDPNKQIFITEGLRKADAGVSIGVMVIALLGVWNFRGTNEYGGKTALADWEMVALNDRDVFIVFDSDVMTNPKVAAALRRLKAFLESRRAQVRAIYLPPGPDGAKVGLDDFIAAGGTEQDLLALAEDELRDVAQDDKGEDTGPYYVQDGRTYWAREVRDEIVPTQLANFTAQIIEDVTEDDGAEVRQTFRIEACLGERIEVFGVSAERFESIRWATEHLGAKATVSAGMGTRDRMREAVQRLSRDVPARRVFRHTGMRVIDGHRVYLHAGGAIGADGVHEGIEVVLDPPFDRYLLPPPPHGEDLVRAVRADLALLELAPARLTFPLFATVPIAVLEVGASVSEHVTGTTGLGKTEIAALNQRRFGETMDAANLPGSWSSTANALEAQSFVLLGAVFTIDDFKPPASKYGAEKSHADADRLFRARGNSLGRSRGRPDGSVRSAKAPRALIVSTGEDVPMGHSLRARMVVLTVQPGDIDFEKLTELQAQAALYPQATAGFIQWVIATELTGAHFRAEVEQVRAELVTRPQHRRTATNAATLLVGLRTYMRFARAAGAVSEAEVQELLEQGEQGILEAVAAQDDHQEAADPVRIFCDLLGQTLQAGGAHLVDRASGHRPGDDALSRALGWRLGESEDDCGSAKRREWRPNGPCVGWIDPPDGDVYLLPDPSYQAAQRAADGVMRIPVQARTLWKALGEARLLRSTDPGRNTKKVRIGEQQRNAIHLGLDTLLSGTGTTGTAGTEPESEAHGAVGRDLFPMDVPVQASETGTANGNTDPADGPSEALVPDVPVVPAGDGGERQEVDDWYV